jgi:hypothetical protein
MKPILRGKHARAAAAKSKFAKKGPAISPAPQSPVQPPLPSPSAPSALLKRQIQLPVQPVGGGSLAQLLMG